MTLTQQLEDLLPQHQHHLIPQIINTFKPYWFERVGELKARVCRQEQVINLLKQPLTNQDILLAAKYHNADNITEFVKILHNLKIGKVDALEHHLATGSLAEPQAVQP